MSTTLCESCFPDWMTVENLTMAPILPCAQCNEYDPKRHTFRSDPRQDIAEKRPEEQWTKTP